MSHGAACRDIGNSWTKIDSHFERAPQAMGALFTCPLTHDVGTRLKQLRQYEQTTTPTAGHQRAHRAVKTRTLADMGVEVRWLVHDLARTLRLATASDNVTPGP